MVRKSMIFFVEIKFNLLNTSTTLSAKRKLIAVELITQRVIDENHYPTMK